MLVEWLLAHAGEFSDILVLGSMIAGGGIWVLRMLLSGRKQVKGLFEGQEALAKAVKEIANQLKPNGGSSLFDIVKSASKKADDTAAAVTSLAESVQRRKAYQRNFAETITEKPIWESDETGACFWVNSNYAKLAERNTTELVGNGWENFVAPEDRNRVFDEWSDAVARKRIFESSYRVKSKSGKTFQVKAVAMPILNDNGKVLAFVGRFDEVAVLT